MRAFLATLLLVASALVLMPAAEAQPVPPGPCYAKDYVNGPVHVYTTMGCATFVDVDIMDCLWGEQWNTYRVGTTNVYVRYTSCSSPYETMQQPPPQCIAFAPCPAPVRCTETEVSTTDYFAYLGPHATARLNRDCSVDVIENGLVCPSSMEESQIHRNEAGGKVEVTADSCDLVLYCTCDPLPIKTTTSSIQPPIVCVTDPCWPYPTPLPNDCALKAATPDQIPFLGAMINPRQQLWGNDCDIDVDPIGACAPPSGSTTDRHVGPVHLHLLLCDGGFEPPVLS